MLATLDRRTRSDQDLLDLDVEMFFTELFPSLAAQHGPLVVAGMAALEAPPLTMVVSGRVWSVHTADGVLIATPDASPGAMTLTFEPAQFSDWAQGQRTLNAMWVGGDLRRQGGRQRDVSNWDSLWLALLDGWPVVDDAISFVDRHGAPLDLHRQFTPNDDPVDVAHFLRETGYLHLSGWLDVSDMRTISMDIDQALKYYRPDDGKSWWARLADGTERCVRLQHFVDYSETTAQLLRSESWDQLRQALAGQDPLVQGPVEGNCVEALVKPLGVVAGISDVPWHRDCNFGRHSYRCCSTTVGIAVTAGGETSGQLRVVAGSNRLNMPSDVVSDAAYLPIVPLPVKTGDVTVHLSCTLHEALPPTVSERKVMYTSFNLAQRSEDAAMGGQHLAELRERVHRVRSQTPSPLAGQPGAENRTTWARNP
jgi:hypothetical protein